MADLADVPLGDLMKELQRRLECSSKPKKHLILIGKPQQQHCRQITLQRVWLLLFCWSFVPTPKTKPQRFPQGLFSVCITFGIA